MEEALDGYSGLVKVQLAGPWTLAATIEQPRSLNSALADSGLVSELAASLAEVSSGWRGDRDRAVRRVRPAGPC